jgi:UDP-N-acetylmuramoylalanine--D-glutamate ligase
MRFSIIGAARSGIAAAKLLKARGATVLVSDSSPPKKVQGAVETLAAAGIEAEFGANSKRILDADMVVLSPGVPSDIPVVMEAVSAGIPVISEIEVASWFCPGPVVAVTGTNGKTTTTTLIGQMFTDARLPSVVGGNIGTAFSQIVEEMDAGTTAVLEVSSFQLDHVKEFRPRVSVLLNITPDHLDRYDHSFAKYASSKGRIFARQGSGDTLVYNDDDGMTAEIVHQSAPAAVKKLAFSTRQETGKGAFVRDGHLMLSPDGKARRVLPVGEIRIRGIHNLQNAMAACLASSEAGVPVESVAETLRTFPGVEHRLEPVREYKGVSFVNDSKATNVDSVWYALQSFTAPIVLLLGGRDKGNDYSRLQQLVKERVRSIVAIGESADKVVSAFTGTVPVRVAKSMKEAVRMSAAEARSGDVVLLSPACASFDWFDNYEHRGKVFKEEVASL